ncbi:uncharacterized mitochondrial protein AtMg00810-like [Gossypium arboreum]|uniref:uncharacterized mitochondrial protein AtMg00810-like n=1 Tax=Gossypium arboreum TaxID=29729 RepID=UPI00081944B5|nr:uncharacterized mitochondrial protein AtMg00810-like [Gossypium arboreum]
MIYVLEYVNEIIIIGNDEAYINGFVESLNKQFSLKDLGKLGYFLSIEVSYPSIRGIFLSHRKYVVDLLKRIHMDQAKRLPTPMVSLCSLPTQVGRPNENESEYRSIMGALQYIVIANPKIAFAMNNVCQFMQKPLDVHYKVVKCILRYFQGTVEYVLSFHLQQDCLWSALLMQTGELMWTIVGQRLGFVSSLVATL